MFGILALLFSCQVFASTGLSLNDSFQLALKRSEDLQIQEEQVIQAEERLSQSKGAFFPSINGIATWQKQDDSATFATSPSTQNTMRLNAIQPLFKGLRDFAQLKQQKKSLISTEHLRDQARTQLFLDVSTAYYQLMILFHDVSIFKNQIEVNQKRLIELRNYRKIGRSRVSDVLALESNIALLEASIESSNAQLESAWSAFSFLTGMNSRPQLEDHENIPEKLGALGDYLSKVNSRPDVKASEEMMLASEEGIGFARGGHLPSLDLLGNYYFNRPGVLSPVKWDVQLALTFPIFQGGIVQSQVRQASSIHQQAELQFEKVKRAASEQVELLFRQVNIEKSQQEKQDKASLLAQKNYEAQLKDSRLGLATNIDVLTSLASAQESQRLSNRIQYQTRLDYLKLLAATAERPKK